jgi:hypothetical protein
MNHQRGGLRIAVFRLNPLTRKADMEMVSPENSGLRFLTHPNAPPGPVLRLRQDRRIEILSLSECSSKPEPVMGQNIPGSFAPQDPPGEHPGPERQKDP